MRLWVISALLFLLWIAGLLGTIFYWNWLDAHHFAGVCVIGLLFLAIGSFGMMLQLQEDADDEGEGVIAGRFAAYFAQYFLFLFVFLAGIALFVVATWVLLKPWLGDGLASFIFLLVFLGYIALTIRILGWLAGKGIIGPQYNDATTNNQHTPPDPAGDEVTERLDA